MSAIQFYDEELNELFGEIRATFESLKKEKKANVRSEKITSVQDKMKRIQRVFKQFKVEMNDLPAEKRSEYEIKSKGHGDTIVKLQNDLNWAKDASSRGELMDGATRGSANAADLERMNAAEIVNAAARLQDDSLEALRNAERTGLQTQDVANSAAQQLAAQTAQLNNISGQLDELDSELKRAQKELKLFIRRMATDKVIMAFLFLIVCGVIFLIIWKITHPADKNIADVPSALNS